jgi:hypothetical protein
MKPSIWAKEPPTDAQLAEMRQRNNPDNLPTGHFTGRCGECGSKDLWDDNLTYGCDCCGAIWLLN